MAAFLIRLIVVTLGVALTVTPAEPYALWKRFGPTTTVTPQIPKSLTVPAISSSNGTVAGAVLTATTGTWGNCSACNYAYVWVATADPINGPWTSVVIVLAVISLRSIRHFLMLYQLSRLMQLVQPRLGRVLFLGQWSH